MNKFLLVFLLSLSGNLLFGSHLRCGYITTEVIDCTTHKYRITITVFTNTASEVLFGGGMLYYGDGDFRVVDETQAIARPDLGPTIGIATYSIEHTYEAPAGEYLISYVEPNRNGGVRNIDNSFSTPFYTETSISIDQSGCGSSPEFLTSAVLQAVAGTPFSYSMGVTSSDDNLITYELVSPFQDRNMPVINYQAPENLEINYLSGLLTWDTKFKGQYVQGEYNFAVQANQFVNVEEVYYKTGHIRIDFQLILNSSDLPNSVVLQDNQELDEYSRILVPENAQKKIKVFFETHGIASLEAFSELAGQDNVFYFDAYDSTHEETNFKVGVLIISPNASVVRENPYLVSVRGKSGSLGSDINYLIYTDKILELPVISTPVTATEKDIAEIRIFPNPAHEKINVQVNRSGQSEIILYTVQGSRIKGKVFETQADVLLSDLPAGIYLCEVRRNNSIVKRIKLIKR